MCHYHQSLAHAAVLPLLLLGVSIAESQDVAGSLEQLRSRVKVGDEVTVTDMTGREMQGTIAELSSLSLALMVGKTRTEFAEADVETVSRRDSRWNGTLWGLGVGAVLGAGLDRSLVKYYGRDDISTGSSVGSIATAAAIGAGIGFAVDAMIKGRRVIYSRPSTSTTRRGTVLPMWGPRRTASDAPVLGVAGHDGADGQSSLSAARHRCPSSATVPAGSTANSAAPDAPSRCRAWP
jgi:hypothetical protein